MSTPELARPLRVLPGFPLRLFLLTFIAVLLGAGVLAVRAPLPALTFNASAFANLGQVFAPLLLIATFVERAVEVLLTPLRGEGSDRLQARLDAAQKAGTDAALVSQLQQELASYKNRSREFAFILASALGLIAALCGIRGFAGLLQNQAAAAPAFHTFDILLTGVVIGGGADGIHTIVGAVLDYMEMISQKAQNAGKASSG